MSTTKLLVVACAGLLAGLLGIGCGSSFPDIACFEGECDTGEGSSDTDADDGASDTTSVDTDATDALDAGDAADTADAADALDTTDPGDTDDTTDSADADTADTADTTDTDDPGDTTDADTTDPDVADTDADTGCEVANACGGCGTLANTVGAQCGACAEQAWVCDGEEAVRCDTDTACPGPTCEDGEQNGDETDEDCGGPDCDPCLAGDSCETGRDCEWNVQCASSVCVALVPAVTSSGTLSVAGSRTGESVAVQRRRFVVGSPGANSGAGHAVSAIVSPEGADVYTDIDVGTLAAGDGFGTAVATDGFTMAIGAPGVDGTAGADAGEAFVARILLEGLDTISVREGSAAGATMGSSAGASGMVAFGSPGADETWFAFPNQTGVDRITELSSTTATEDGWGTSLSMIGSYGIVANATAFTLYRTGETWTTITTPASGALGAGISVSVDGTGAAVGAPNRAAGAQVILYSIAGSSASEQTRILAPPGVTGFGRAVSRSEGRLAVSGVDSGGASGVWVYAEIEGTWVLQARLRHPTGAAGTGFGSDVELGGDWLIVGAPQDDTFGTDAGNFFIYDFCPGETHGGACAYSCSDDAVNGGETAVDCGGGVCGPCADGDACATPADCAGGLICDRGTCGSPT